MSAYTTRALSEIEYKDVVNTIRAGYTSLDGAIHRPNEQVATILILEANLGCRIGDIMKLKTDSIIDDGGIWKLNITEQKTGKKRSFIVPAPIKAFIDKWIEANGIRNDYLFSIKSGAVWKALRNVTEYLGLDDTSCHSFRKYAANRLYENSGYDIESVCEFLQHSDTKITRKYIKRSDEQLERAILSSVAII